MKGCGTHLQVYVLSGFCTKDCKNVIHTPYYCAKNLWPNILCATLSISGDEANPNLLNTYCTAGGLSCFLNRC